MNRSSAVLLFAAMPVCLQAAEQPAKVLVFTRSQTFEHTMVKVSPGKQSQIEIEMAAMGLANNFSVTVTKDGGEITAEKLKPYDLVVFYTTGDLTKEGKDGSPPMSMEGKQALLEAIAGGKGFVGLHCASDTFHSADESKAYEAVSPLDPYIVMLGGEFIHHQKQQPAKIVTVDSAFPGMNAVGESFVMTEEWYSLKHFSPDLHVTQIIDTQGMEGEDYQRGPYPITWIHPYGKGRVFYTAMGHREDVWTNITFRSVLAGGIDYALGRKQVDDKPNLELVAPKHAELPPKPPAKAEKPAKKAAVQK